MSMAASSKSEKKPRWTAGTIGLVVVCVLFAVGGLVGLIEAINQQKEDSISTAVVIALCVAVWVGFAWAVGQYAKSKGCDPTGVVVLSLFLSPLIGFIVAALMKPNEKKAAVAQGKKQCPMCAEFVQPEAKICRYCRYNFEEKRVA
jgi:predicted tellurium resistance membrane protein TerC